MQADCSTLTQAAKVLPNPGTLFSALGLVLEGTQAQVVQGLDDERDSGRRARAQEDAVLKEAMRVMVLVITKAGVVPDDRVWVRLLSACHVFSQSTGPGAVSAEALLGVLLECMRAQSLEPYFNSAVLRALWARREGAGAAGEHDAAQNDAGGASSAISTAGGSGVDAGSPARNAVPPSPRPADVVTEVLADLEEVSAHMRARQVSACVRVRARARACPSEFASVTAYPLASRLPLCPATVTRIRAAGTLAEAPHQAHQACSG